MTGTWAPALASLTRTLETLEAGQLLSPARLRQLRWVRNELTQAAGEQLLPDPAAGDLAELLSPVVVTDYLAVAAAGELRTRAADRPARENPNSTRVRLRCLELFAEHAGLKFSADPPRPVVISPVTDRSRHLMMRELANLVAAAEGTRVHPERARLHALIGVVLDTGARAGELCAMKLADLAYDRSTLEVHRSPQAAGAGQVETYELTGRTRAALRTWLAVRDALVETLDGTSTALWVSVRHNHLDDGRPWPAGLPLRPRGLARAYRRIAEELNLEQAGAGGWEPLPLRMEQLRRTTAGTGPSPLRSREA